MEITAADVKMKESCAIFPWVKKVRKRLLKSFHEDNADDQLLLQQYLHEEFQKLLYNKDNMRVEAFYKTISYFYLHFCWRVNWNKDYPMKFSCVQLLYYMVFVGLMLGDGDVTSHWMDQVLTILKFFPGDTYLMFDALLLIQNLKKKYHKAFALILKHILCKEVIKNPSNSESFMKVLLLFRRLKCLSKGHVKKSTISSLASSVKCPPDFVNWTSLNIGNLSGLSCENAAEDFINRNLKFSAMKNIFQVLFGNKYDEKIISPAKLQKNLKEIKPPCKKKNSKICKQNFKTSISKSVKSETSSKFGQTKCKKIDEEGKHILPLTKCDNESSVSKSKQTRKEIHSQDMASPITLLVKETASVSHQRKKEKLNHVKYSEISTPSSSPETNDIESWPITQEKSSDSISAYANYSNGVNHSFSLIDSSSKDQWSLENPDIFNSTLTSDLQDQDCDKVSNNELNHVCNISINPPLILSDCKSNTKSFSVPLHDKESDYGIDDTIKFTDSSDIEMTATPLSYEKINLSKSRVCQNMSSKVADKSSLKSPSGKIAMNVKSSNSSVLSTQRNSSSENISSSKFLSPNSAKKQKSRSLQRSKKSILSLDNIPLDEQAVPKVNNVNDMHASILETSESTSGLNTQQKSPSQSVNPLNASTTNLSSSKYSKLSSSVNSTKRKRSRKLKKSVELILNSDSNSSDQKSTDNCIKSSVDILNANNVGDSSLNLQLKCSLNSDRQIFQDCPDKSSLSLKTMHSESYQSFGNSNSGTLKFSSESSFLGEISPNKSSHLSVNSSKIPKSKRLQKSREFILESDTNSSKDLNNLQNNCENNSMNYTENNFSKIQSECINNVVPSGKNPEMSVNYVDKIPFNTQSKYFQSIHSDLGSLASSQSLFPDRKPKSSKLQKTLNVIPEYDNGSCHNLNVSSNKTQGLLINSSAENCSSGSSSTVKAKSAISNTALSDINSDDVISENCKEKSLHIQSLHSYSGNSKSLHEINVTSLSAETPCVNSEEKSSRRQKFQNFLSESERDSHSDINLVQNEIHTALNVSDAKNNSSFSTFETQSHSYHLDKTSHFKKKKERSAMFVSESDSSSSQISKISTDRRNKLSNSNGVEIKTFHETLPDSSDSDSKFHSVSTSDCDTDYSEESSLNINSNSLVKEISTSNECSKIQAYSINQKTLCTLSPTSQKLIYCNSILENSKDFKKASLTFEGQKETLLNDTNSELCQTPSGTQKNLKIVENCLPMEHSLDSNGNSHKNQVASEPVFSCFSSVKKPKSSKRKSASEIQKGLRIKLLTSENHLHLPEEHSLDSNGILYENQAEFERLERNSSNDVCLSQNKIQNPVNDCNSEYISRSSTLKVCSKLHFSDKISHLKKKRYTRKKSPKTSEYISESDSDVADTNKFFTKNELERDVPDITVSCAPFTLEKPVCRVVTTDSNTDYLEEASTSNEISENQQNLCVQPPKCKEQSHNLLLKNRYPNFENSDTLLHDFNKDDIYKNQTLSDIKKCQGIKLVTLKNCLNEEQSLKSNDNPHKNQAESEKLCPCSDLERSKFFQRKPLRYISESKRVSLNDLSHSQNKLHNPMYYSNNTKSSSRVTLKVPCVTSTPKKPNYHKSDSKLHSCATSDYEIDFLKESFLKSNTRRMTEKSSLNSITIPITEEPSLKSHLRLMTEELSSTSNARSMIEKSSVKAHAEPVVNESSLKSDMRNVTKEMFLKSNIKPVTKKTSLNVGMKHLVKNSSLNANTMIDSNAKIKPSDTNSISVDKPRYFKREKKSTQLVSDSDSDFYQIIESSVNTNMEHLIKEPPINSNKMNNPNDIDPGLTLKNHLSSICFNKAKHSKMKQKSSPLLFESDCNSQTNKICTMEELENNCDSKTLKVNKCEKSNASNAKEIKKTHKISTSEIPNCSLDKSSYSKKRRLWSALLESESDNGSNSMEINELGTSAKETKKSYSSGISNCSFDKSSYSKKRRPASLVLESDSESFKTNEILTEKGLETISGTRNMDVNKLEKINGSNVKTMQKISPSAKPNCGLDKFVYSKTKKRRSAILVSESDSDSIQNKILTEKGLETISDTNNMDVNKLEKINESNVKKVSPAVKRRLRSAILVSESDSDSIQTDKFLTDKRLETIVESNYSKKRKSVPLETESDSDSIQTDKFLTDKGLETIVESKYSKKRKPVPLETESDNDSPEILTLKELGMISDSDGMEINKLVNDCNISCKQDIFPEECLSNKGDSVKNMPVCDIREKLCPVQPLFEMGDTNAKNLLNTNFNRYFLKDTSCISKNVLNDIYFNKEGLFDDKHESNNELTKNFRDNSTNLAYRKKLSTENVVSITLPETQYPFGANNDSIKHMHFELNKDLHIKSDSSRSSVHSEMINVSYHYFRHYSKSQVPLLNENSTTTLSCNSLQISAKEKTQDLSGEMSQPSCNLPKYETSYNDEFKNRLNLQFKQLIHNSPLSLQFQVKSGSDNCMSNKDLTQSVTQLMINQPVCGLVKPFSEKNNSRYLVEKHSNDFIMHKKQIRRKQVLPKRIVTESLKNNWIYWSKMDILQQIQNDLAYPIINCSYLKHSRNKSGVFLCKGKCFRNVKSRFEVYLQNEIMLFNYKISPYPIVDLGQKCDNNDFKQSQRSIQQKHVQFCGNNSVKCNKYNFSKSNYKNKLSTSNNWLKPSFLGKRKLFCSLNKYVHVSQPNESTANHSHKIILNHLAKKDVTKTNNTVAESMLNGYNLRKRRKSTFTCSNLML